MIQNPDQSEPPRTTVKPQPQSQPQIVTDTPTDTPQSQPDTKTKQPSIAEPLQQKQQQPKLTQVIIINNSTYNLQIISNHESGLKIKTLISNNYTKWVQQFKKDKDNKTTTTPDSIKNIVVHRMYYPQFPILKLGPKDALANQGKAYDIICTKPMIKWDQNPQFVAVCVERPVKEKF